MGNPRVLRASLTVSLLVHAALYGLLVWWAVGSLARPDRPLRVRILPAPAAPAPPAPPGVRPAPAPRAPAPRLPRARGAEEPGRTAPRPVAPAPPPAPPRAAAPAPPAPRLEAGAGPREPAPARPSLEADRVPPRPSPGAGEAPAPPPRPADVAPAPAAPVPPVRPPSVEARPIPREEPAPALQPVPPRVEAKLPVVPEKAPAPPAPLPEGGLSLGGPAQGRPDLSARREAERPGLPALRRSLRDQIASLGTGMTAETGEQTVNLDSQEPRFLSYLARVKRRIQRTWTYPPDALALGLGGELVLVFTLNPAGTLTDLALIRSSGFPVLDEEALRAVKAAAPFDPFPAELGREPWNISAAFHYTLPRASRPR